MTRRRLPLLLVGAAVTVALVAAGCGGGGGKKQPPALAQTQIVRGAGYTFAAPTGWSVTGTTRGVDATGPGRNLLSVSVYKLVKPYAPARFAAAAKELDKVAAQLAAGRKGTLRSKETRTVAGLQVRSYRIAYAHEGQNLEQQVTFVLRDSTEWQLVCRRATADPDDHCARLLSTFTLASR